MLKVLIYIFCDEEAINFDIAIYKLSYCPNKCIRSVGINYYPVFKILVFN